MSIKKLIAATITAAFVLSLTACASYDAPPVVNSGYINYSKGSESSALAISASNPMEGNVAPDNSDNDLTSFKYKYDSELDGIVITDYTGSSAKVMIPDTIEGKPVVEVGLKHANYGLTELILPNSVTKIGENAFKGCTNLAIVTIPDSVTEIGNYAFDECTSLASITIPANTINIGNSPFRNCSGLTSIDVANGNPKYYSFEGILCERNKEGALTLLRCPPGKSGSIIIPDSVTEIGGEAFGGSPFSDESCKSITSIAVPASVTKIYSRSFGGCTALTSINVAEGNPTYFSIDGILYFKNKNGETVLGLCPAGKSGDIVIPDDVSVIDNLAFSGGLYDGCKNITSITIPESVTEIDPETFCGCSGLISVKISSNPTRILSSTFSGCTSLENITIPDSVTLIGNYAFSDCTSLTGIKIPDFVRDIGYTAFKNCKNIQATYKGKTYDYEHIDDLYKAINGN